MRVTGDEFEGKLEEVLRGLDAGVILSIPGVYEVLAEHFNDDVFDAIAEDRRAEGTCPSCGEGELAFDSADAEGGEHPGTLRCMKCGELDDEDE